MQNAVEDVWRFAIRNSYLIASVQYLSNILFVKGAHSDVMEEPPGWEDAEMALGETVELAREHGIRLLNYLYQTGLSQTPPPPLNLYRQVSNRAEYLDSNVSRFIIHR